MDARFRRVVPVFLFLSIFFACTPGGPGEEAAGTEGEEGEAGVENEVHLEPQQLEAWGIELGSVGRTTIAAELTLPGALAVNENRTARVAPLVSGQISGPLADLGSRVGAGQTLATLNSPEFTRAQTEFLQAYAEAELSRKDFERAQALRESRAIEEREFLRREAVYEQQLASRRAAEVVLHSLGIDEDHLRELERAVDVDTPPRGHAAVGPPGPGRTPIGGVVIERTAVLGDHVEPGQNLFTVSDLTSLWALLDAYENQMASLDEDADVVIRSPAFPGRDFPGRITFVSDQVDEELRTIGVRVEVPNADGLLRPNMYVQGLLRVPSEDERLVVPVDAVQLLEGHHVVFVLQPSDPGEDHLVLRAVDVEPGETLSGGRIIEAGLDGTETIVTTGSFNLKAEMTKGVGGHGHVH